ncbi:MAG: thiamine diphosphokinase [Christensenellales bacterium]
MDGHFAPNISFGPDFVRAIRRQTNLFLDTHLMLSRPMQYIEAYAKAGADLITVHVEAEDNCAETLEAIHALGVRAGREHQPETPVSALEPLLPLCDLVLVMTVKPGFGGQTLREDCVAKIPEIRKMIERTGRDILIEVDGGVKQSNAARSSTRARICWSWAGLSARKTRRPSFRASWGRDMRAMIVLGGDAPGVGLLKACAAEADFSIAADRGLEAFDAAGIEPDMLIGDMDSVSPQVLARYESRLSADRLNCIKDDTDGEYALNLALEKGATEITLLGALGGRLDHALANLMMVVRAARHGAGRRFARRACASSRVNGSCTLAGARGSTISLLPLGTAGA